MSAQSEAPSVETILASLSVFASSGADLTTEEILTVDKPLKEAVAKINRLIVKGRLERGIYELERLEHDPQMFGDWEKVIEERIYLLESELSALSNNLSKGGSD